jgi:NitT/TauT family transport system substrate-binding protein
MGCLVEWRLFMRFVNWFALAAVGAGAAFATDAAAAERAPVKFVMDWAFEGAQAIWTVAADRGCFAQAGLDVKIDRGFGSGDAVSKVASGAYDIGVADFSTLVSYNGAHPGEKLIAAFVISDRSATSVVTLKKNGISKPQDLVGKRLADAQGEASRVLFPAFAKANGIDPGAVTWVTVAPNLRQTTLFHGQADAAAGHLFTVITGLQALGVSEADMVEFPYADFGVSTFGNSVIVKPEWAAAHPDIMRSFIRCAVAGIKGSIADPRYAIASLKKFNAMADDKTESTALAFSTNRAILSDDVRKYGLSAMESGRLDRVLSQVADALQILKPAAADVWTAAYLPPRDELMLPP